MRLADLAKRWSLGADRETTPLPTGDFVSVNGVGVHYIERGQGRPVVFLHGAALMADELFCGPAGAALSRGYRLIAFDRPGYGHSGRGEDMAGPRAQAWLIRGALLRLGVTRPILIGHSWSGALVLHYGLEFPDDVTGIVSLAGWSFAEHQTSIKLLSSVFQGGLDTAMAAPFAPQLARHIVSAGMERVYAPEMTPGGYAALPVGLMIRPTQLHANADDLSALNRDVLKIQRQYRRFRVPIEILVGTKDTIVDPDRHGRRLARLIPGAKLAELENAGHMLHQTRTDELLAAVGRLAEVT